MKNLNVIILIGLAGLAFMMFKLMKAVKLQTEVMTALAVKNGVLKPIKESKKKISKQNDDDQHEDESQDDGNDRAPKKVKLKKLQKQIVDLFEDGFPKKLGEVKKAFVSRHGKIEDDVKFNNTMYNLKPSNVITFEKIDDVNYWGLGEWFDEDGQLFEEYVEKIPGTSALTITTNT